MAGFAVKCLVESLEFEERLLVRKCCQSKRVRLVARVAIFVETSFVFVLVAELATGVRNNGVVAGVANVTLQRCVGERQAKFRVSVVVESGSGKIFWGVALLALIAKQAFVLIFVAGNAGAVQSRVNAVRVASFTGELFVCSLGL